MKQRKTSAHKKYTNEEKLQIVLLYLDHHMGRSEIIRKYDISSRSVLHRWIYQYQTYGKIIDGSGKANKLDTPNKGRPRNRSEKSLDELSKEELIEKVRMLEDIKKSLVYLMNQRPKTNIK